MSDTTRSTSSNLQFERTEDFISLYANSAIFESSAWDLKIIFGQLDQSFGKGVVKQHLAVTIPWALAKLALYWLRMHVEAMEIQTGKISVRKDLLPPEPPPLTPEQERDPVTKKLYERVRKLREDFIASL